MTSLPQEIVMASGNSGKIQEMVRLLQTVGVSVLAQSEFGVSDADETGTTLAENSLLKAKHASTVTGLAAIADDSGLFVDALDGAPGVHSARYAGIDASDDLNIDKLLSELRNVSDRRAAFHCVVTLVLPHDDNALVATGMWRGSILKSRQGSGGFGYDPVFFDPESGRSAAQLSAAEKNAKSHRGAAIRAMRTLLEQRFS